MAKKIMENTGRGAGHIGPDEIPGTAGDENPGAAKSQVKKPRRAPIPRVLPVVEREEQAKPVKKHPEGTCQLWLGLVLVGIVGLLSLISVFYTPYDVYAMDTASRFLPPSLTHFFGTDNYGRDVFSRAMTGAGFTLFVAFATVASSTLISIVIGLISGYAGGIVDEILMRLLDAVSSFPGILIALVIVSVMNNGKYTIILALCIMFIPSFSRIVRTGTLQYKDAGFVRNARVFGASAPRLLFVYILPNIFPILLSSVVIGLSNAILAESGMSYLGLGIQPPIPSLGRMLYEAQNIILRAPWCALAPGLVIVTTIAGFHCIGEGLRKRYL